MLDVRAVRQQLAAALTGRGLTLSDTLPTGNAKLPLAVVGPPSEVRYHITGGRQNEADFTITVAVASKNWAQAQAVLDGYMSWSGGLAQALEAHETDAWRSLVVDAAREVRQLTIGQANALAFDLVITVRN